MPASRDDVTAPAGCAIAIDPDSDAGRILAFRRSLRASRTRRDGAVRRRRRVLRSRGSAFVAAAGMLVASAGALAQQESSGSGGGLSTATIASAQRALGVDADGVVGPRTRRAVRRFQRDQGLSVDGVIGAQTLKALGVGAGDDTEAGAADAVLARIAACESGGNPTAVSADGQYHGKYQFSLATWRQVGGSGDPADAAEAEQDRRAATLLAQAGPSSWPNCA
jgi:hypothetical protein